MDVSSGRAGGGGPSTDGIPLPKMEYRDLEGTSRFFQLSGQGIPPSFLSLLRGVIVVSHEFIFIIAGNSLASTLDIFNSLACPSGNLLNILRQSVGVASSLFDLAPGSSNDRRVKG